MTPQQITELVKSYYGISDLTCPTHRYPYPSARAAAIVLMWEAGVHIPDMMLIVGLKRERIYAKYYAAVNELRLCPKSKFSLEFAQIKKSITFDESTKIIMPKRNDEEHRIQCGIVNYLRLNNFFVFAVPNGGKRDERTGKMLKDEGALAGVADLIILFRGECFFVEVKTAKSAQSQTQKDFQAKVESMGFRYLMWRSLDDCIRWVDNPHARLLFESGDKVILWTNEIDGEIFSIADVCSNGSVFGSSKSFEGWLPFYTKLSK